MTRAKKLCFLLHQSASCRLEQANRNANSPENECKAYSQQICMLVQDFRIYTNFWCKLMYMSQISPLVT